MLSSEDSSVAGLCHQLQSGNEDAASVLWRQFFSRLVDLAGKRIEGTSRLIADEEDVALSAFKSFCKGMRQGKFAALTDHDSLWRLLVVITSRKASDLANYNRRSKRSELRVVTPRTTEVNDDLVQSFICRQPTPDAQLEMEENIRSAIDQLKHEDLQQIALLKLDGYTNQEIAKKMDRGLSTIERKLRTIRGIWSQLG